MHRPRTEARLIFGAFAVFFLAFLAAPLAVLLVNSLNTGRGVGLGNYFIAAADKSVLKAIGNSIQVSAAAAAVSTLLAFLLAYTINCTRLNSGLKRLIATGVAAPMLLPTITYGFAIIYSFGKQGLLTKLFGRELFQIYGFNGLLMGYVIYTLPAAFLLINNSFGYIDRKFTIVATLMGDGFWRSFVNTVLRPLTGTLGGAFVLAFILSFTDFGIPASVGGTYNVIATQLYQVMLGALPDFNMGSVIAVFMLMPAVFGIALLNYLERFNFQYTSLSVSELLPGRLRDLLCGGLSLAVVTSLAAVFAVMFVAPLVKNYPYDLSFSSQFFQKVLFSRSLFSVYENSLLVAFVTAAAGTVISYAAALIRVRTGLSRGARLGIDLAAMVSNTAPGMVLGLAYLFLFNASDLKGTFAILILCNIVHFFTTPYLMAKNSLGKLNPAWETTGELMGDTWLQTVCRVILPNSLSTVIEMFSFYFINAMVTISAVIFLVSARTAVVTSKIKELEHYASFNEIFVLSILIFVTNILVRGCCDRLQRRSSSKNWHRAETM